jgi:hypothetical protein
MPHDKNNYEVIEPDIENSLSYFLRIEQQTFYYLCMVFAEEKGRHSCSRSFNAS